MLLQFDEVGEIILTDEAKVVSDTGLYKMIDDKFPYRTADNEPSYRGSQRNIILKMIKACLNGKKFVMLDAPVGSGKSIILYTAMVILGPSVYLTPQNQLQDQIAKEKWPNVRSLKGKSHYACNDISLREDKARCNYSGDEFDTCNNSDHKYVRVEGSSSTVMQSIERTLDYHKGNERSQALHSSFSNIEEAHVLERHVNRDNQEIIKYPVATLMGCSRNPVECPYKTARLRAMYSGVRVLTPDIYYLLNKYTNIFSNSTVMCIDECHTMESTIQRMFRTRIPIETIKDIFGIDLSILGKCEGAVEFTETFQKIFQTDIKPIMAAMRVMHKMGDLLKVKKVGDFSSVNNDGEFAKIMNRSVGLIANMDNFPLFEITNAVFSGNGYENVLDIIHEFKNEIRFEYEDELEKLGLDKDTTFDLMPLIKSCERYVLKTTPRDLIKNLTYEAINVSTSINKIFETWNDTIILMSQIKYKDENEVEYPVFTIEVGEDVSTSVCESIKPLQRIANRWYRHDAFHKEIVVGVVPVNIATILHYFFYRNVRTVFLSTGTWVDLVGKKRMYGISSSCEHIKVPSIFNRIRRPVFVLDDKRYTNFSEKNPNGKGYVYRTVDGTQKFLDEFHHTISSVQKWILEQDGIENPNIIVHCHTFDLARRIAEEGEINDNYLIHLGKDIGSTIQNYHSGVIDILPKEEILDRIINNPDSGLIAISPSINEGVDFKHGIARAQIVLKRPVPYLGDVYVKMIRDGCKELGIYPDPKFFDREVFTTTVQQYGRIMRAENDWGYTFIIDQSMTMQMKQILIQRSRGILTNLNIGYFVEGVHYFSGRYGISFTWPLDGMYNTQG